MKRRLCNLTLIASTLLSLAIAVVWVRSHRAGEVFVLAPSLVTDRATPRVVIYTDDGMLLVIWGRQRIDPGASVSLESMGWTLNPSLAEQYPVAQDIGPAIDPPADLPPTPSLQLQPTGRLWLHLAWPFALAALAPTIWTIRLVRAHRCVPIGHCPCCGYDLRATPERCPECGAIAAGGRGAAKTDSKGTEDDTVRG